jgi:hypothetical protein
MMYFLERIKLALAGEDIGLHILIKLMGRCLKLYDMIHQFIKTFKLIEKVEIMEELKKPDATLMKRLKVSIRMLLKENQFLPTFLFKGKDLLAEIKCELRKLGHEEIDESPMPPRKMHSEDMDGSEIASINDSIIEL